MNNHETGPIRRVLCRFAVAPKLNGNNNARYFCRIEYASYFLLAQPCDFYSVERACMVFENLSNTMS